MPKTVLVPLKAWVAVDRNGYLFTGGFTLSESGVGPMLRRAMNDADPKDLPFEAVPVTIMPRVVK